MLDLTQGQFVKHVIMHPFEGFEDLRWKKAGSMKIAIGIVCLFFIQALAYSRMYGFQYYSDYDKIFNIVPYIFQSFGIFLLYVVCNWAMCTLFDGEGSMKNICCVSAYALVPYLITQVVVIIASNVLLKSEGAFIVFFQYLGILWSVVLIISAMKTVHQYTIPKTLIAMIFTVAAMVVILFLLVLLMSLFQQVYVFGFSIYTELMYRFSI